MGSMIIDEKARMFWCYIRIVLWQHMIRCRWIELKTQNMITMKSVPESELKINLRDSLPLKMLSM